MTEPCALNVRISIAYNRRDRGGAACSVHTCRIVIVLTCSGREAQ
jgi:hypothetical protein